MDHFGPDVLREEFAVPAPYNGLFKAPPGEARSIGIRGGTATDILVDSVVVLPFHREFHTDLRPFRSVDAGEAHPARDIVVEIDLPGAVIQPGDGLGHEDFHHLVGRAFLQDQPAVRRFPDHGLLPLTLPFQAGVVDFPFEHVVQDDGTAAHFPVGTAHKEVLAAIGIFDFHLAQEAGRPVRRHPAAAAGGIEAVANQRTKGILSLLQEFRKIVIQVKHPEIPPVRIIHRDGTVLQPLPMAV